MNGEFEARKRPSRWWYLLPIFLGLLGGIAGYLLVQERDKKFAKRLIILGIIMTVVWVVIWLVASLLLQFLAYQYISGVFEEETAAILEVVDSYCSAGTVTLTLRNVGTNTLPASQQTCTQTSGECSGSCVPVNLEPGRATTLTINGCTSGRAHSWRISGPTTSVTATVYCV